MKKTLILIGILGAIAINGQAQTKVYVSANSTEEHSLHGEPPAKRGVAVKSKHARKHKTTKNTLPPLNGCIVNSEGETQYITGRSTAGHYPAGFTTVCDINSNLKTSFPDMVITSSAFAANGVLPAKYTCKGQAASPPLKVGNVPEGAMSLAVIMYDPQATTKNTHTNWMIWNLTTDGVIPENFATDHQSENPMNHQYGYQGVCPSDGTHYYHVRAYALDRKLFMDKHTTKAIFEEAIKGHVLAKGEIICQSHKNVQ